MEPLWSPAAAISGNRWQMERPRKWLRQAKTVAVGCDRLPIGSHGKEGVSGSSPEEGFQNNLQSGNFGRVVLPDQTCAGTSREHQGTLAPFCSRLSSLMTRRPGRSARVDPLALGAEDRERLGRAVDGHDRVRHAAGELAGLAGLEHEVLLSKHEPEPA
jgi:hypothetical protein